MTVTIDTDLLTQTLVLQVYEPRDQVSLDFAAMLLTQLADMHRTASSLRRIVQPQFSELPRGAATHSARLMVRRIEGGSLLVELVQDVVAPGGALTILIVAHALKNGTGKLYEWARLPNDLRKEWYQSRITLLEAKAEANRLRQEAAHATGFKRARLEKRATIIEEGAELVELRPPTGSSSKIELANTQIEKLAESHDAIRQLSDDLEVHVLDESGSQVPDPFRRE